MTATPPTPHPNLYCPAPPSPSNRLSTAGTATATAVQPPVTTAAAARATFLQPPPPNTHPLKRSPARGHRTSREKSGHLHRVRPVHGAPTPCSPCTERAPRFQKLRKQVSYTLRVQGPAQQEDVAGPPSHPPAPSKSCGNNTPCCTNEGFALSRGRRGGGGVTRLPTAVGCRCCLRPRTSQPRVFTVCESTLRRGDRQESASFSQMRKSEIKKFATPAQYPPHRSSETRPRPTTPPPARTPGALTTLPCPPTCRAIGVGVDMGLCPPNCWEEGQGLITVFEEVLVVSAHRFGAVALWFRSSHHVGGGGGY